MRIHFPVSANGSTVKLRKNRPESEQDFCRKCMEERELFELRELLNLWNSEGILKFF
jgi:hypothetical protein